MSNTGTFDPAAFGDEGSLKELVSLMRRALEGGRLGGAPGGFMPTAAGLTYSNMEAASMRTLLDTVNRNDIRVQGLSDYVLRAVHGESEARRIRSSAGMGFVNNLAGTLLNSPGTGVGAMFGGSLTDAAMGYQSAISASFLGMNGRSFGGFGSGTSAATVALSLDMQKRLFAAGGTVSKTGFNYSEIGALTAQMGSQGAFRGMNLGLEFNGTNLNFNPADIKAFNTKVADAATTLRALKDVLGPDSSMADLIEGVKTIGGTELGKPGSLGSFSRNLSSLRLAAGGAGFDERRAVSMQLGAYNQFMQMGFGANSTGAANFAVQTAMESAGRSGRLDLAGDALNMATQQAAIIYQKGGQADLVKMSQVAMVHGSPAQRAQAQAFLASYAANPAAAYSQSSGLMVEFGNMANRLGGLDAAYARLGDGSKAGTDALLKTAMEKQRAAKLSFEQDRVDIGQLSGSRSDLLSLLGAVGSADASKLILGKGDVSDLTPSEMAALKRLRSAGQGMDESSLYAITGALESAGGNLAPNRRGTKAFVQNALNKTGSILGGDAARSGFGSLLAGFLGDKDLSDVEALTSAAIATMNGGDRADSFGGKLLRFSGDLSKNESVLKAAGLSVADLQGMSEDDQALRVMKALNAKGFSVGTDVQEVGRENYVDSNAKVSYGAKQGHYIAMAGEHISGIKAGGARLGLMSSLRKLGFSLSEEDAIAAAAHGGPISSIEKFLTADSMLGAKIGTDDQKKAFREAVSAMSPLEYRAFRLKLDTDDTTISTKKGSRRFSNEFLVSTAGMSPAQFASRAGLLSEEDLKDTSANNKALSEIEKARQAGLSGANAKKLQELENARPSLSAIGSIRIENGQMLIDNIRALIGGTAFGDLGATPAK